MVYGALTSLVYNRGSDIGDKESRKEMKNIHLAFNGEIKFSSNVQKG